MRLTKEEKLQWAWQRVDFCKAMVEHCDSRARSIEAALAAGSEFPGWSQERAIIEGKLFASKARWYDRWYDRWQRILDAVALTPGRCFPPRHKWGAQ